MSSTYNKKLMTQIKNFFLNNEHYTTQDEINLYDLITYFDYTESLLVLEYNRVIFDKSYSMCASIFKSFSLCIPWIISQNEW